MRNLVERLPVAQVDEVTDAGYFTPQFTPPAVAERFVRFFQARD